MTLSGDGFSAEGRHLFKPTTRVILSGAKDLSVVPLHVRSANPGSLGQQSDDGLIVEDVFDGGDDGFGLGEDDVFELGLVGAEGVHGGDALYGGVELVEKLFADAGGDFGAVAEAAHVFVGNDDAMIFADGRGDRVPVVGSQRAEVDDFDGDA